MVTALPIATAISAAGLAPAIVKLPLLTNSALKSWRACQRKYQFRYELGYQPVATASTLAFGTVIHQALEWFWLWFQGKLNHFPSPLAAALDVFRTAELDPYSRVKAQAMVTGYVYRWSEWAKTVTVLAVEAEFRLPLRNPATSKRSRSFDLGGKIDLIVQLSDGTIAIVEHKSSSEDISVGSNYRGQLAMDSQISQYFAGARALGYDASICIFDVLAKPKIRPLEANKSRSEVESPGAYGARCASSIGEDPDRYFAHIEVVRLDSEREEWSREVWQQARNIVEAKKTAVFPRTPEACYSYHRPCEFHAVCTGLTAIDNPSQFRKLDNAHPELFHV